jgi:hypothetical protein
MGENMLRLQIERGDEQIRQTVVSIMNVRGLDVETVADDVGIPLGALRKRVVTSGSSYAFTAGEVRALADYFGVEGGELFRYMDGRFLPESAWRPLGFEG